jgi:hypothetical protein
LNNPKRNIWKSQNKNAIFSEDGRTAVTRNNKLNIFAEKGFHIPAEENKDNFLGNIVYYFEVTQMSASKTWVI